MLSFSLVHIVHAAIGHAASPLGLTSLGKVTLPKIGPFREKAGLQAYGQTQQQGLGFDYTILRTKLEKMVHENRLQHFYPPQRLDQVAQRVAAQDVAGLGRLWRLPREVTLYKFLQDSALQLGQPKPNDACMQVCDDKCK